MRQNLQLILKVLCVKIFYPPWFRSFQLNQTFGKEILLRNEISQNCYMFTLCCIAMGNCLRLCVSTAEDDTLLPEQLDQDSSSSPPTPIEERPPEPVFFVSPNVGRPISQLTEDEQVKIAQRIGFIQQLPTGIYNGANKNKECAICMVEFAFGDSIRYLPCLHIYHASCIDDWLMRSFTCPSCMEPVDAALLSTFHTKYSH